MDAGLALSQEAAWFAQALQNDGTQNMDARIRSVNYRPRLEGGKFMCPRCWVKQSARQPLRPVPGTDDYDMLRCGGCGADFIIPLGA